MINMEDDDGWEETIISFPPTKDFKPGDIINWQFVIDKNGKLVYSATRVIKD